MTYTPSDARLAASNVGTRADLSRRRALIGMAAALGGVIVSACAPAAPAPATSAPAPATSAPAAAAPTAPPKPTTSAPTQAPAPTAAPAATQAPTTDAAVKPAAGGTLVVGSVLDATGPLNIYGKVMVDATDFAIDDINTHGGVLGKQLKPVAYDAQSDNDKYAQFANQLILQDKAVVIMGGITSASREAIRPAMDKNNQLYFYNEQYEGGVCDKYVFCTGVVPSQQLSTLIGYAGQNGTKKIYTLAADYNYGQISSDWVKFYVAKNPGMTQVGLDFFGLDVTDFSAALNKVQASGADTVMSLLVGGNHISFYRQFAAAGLKDKIKIVSPTYGLGNEQVVLSPTEGQGIIVSYPYFQELPNATNKAWVDVWHKRFGADYAYITDSANAVWTGWHLWAMAANKAGSTDLQPVITALESGVAFDAPEGKVTLDPKTHHLVHNANIAVGNAAHGFDIQKTYDAIGPDPQGQCDLIATPDQHTQLTPKTS